MKIGVCDDDKYWLEQAEHILNEYAIGKNISFELFFCSTTSEMTNCLKMHQLDIAFLDIEMEEEATGIDLAEIINKTQPACNIIYLTNYIHYAVDVYETDHVYFVLKEQFEKRLEDIFKKTEFHKSRMLHQIGFQMNKTNAKVVYEYEILYFERKLRNTIVHLQNEEFTIKDTMDELEERIDKIQFVRCHHSFIVYFSAIDEIQRDKIIMKNGGIIPISRRYKDNLKEKFTEWVEAQSL